MDERVDILDEDGNPTGQSCLKSEAHAKGLFHPTIHVWFYTTAGEILFQQRAQDKDTFPLLWDVSVAGHIGAGEEIAHAAVREVEEEIGLTISEVDLNPIGAFKSVHNHKENFIDAEFHHTFLCELKVPISSLVIQESEVENLRLLPLLDFKAKVDSNMLEGFVPNTSMYYKEVIAAIAKAL